MTSTCSGACAAGTYCPGGTVTPQTCPAGTYSNGTAAACTPCAAGLYGATVGTVSSACTGQCSVGSYGNDTGATTESCSGPCPPGYQCPAPGTTAASMMVCPPGKYSYAGAATCSPCLNGYYGATAAMTSQTCTGLCDAGRYGAAKMSRRLVGTVSNGIVQRDHDPEESSDCDTSALAVDVSRHLTSTFAPTTSDCSGPCPAGYYCGVGTGFNSWLACPIGQWSDVGAAVCSLCPGGTIGSVAAWPNNTCNGPCPAGSYCPNGTIAGSVPVCPAGTYSNATAAACSPCPSGRYGNTTGMTAVGCTGLCADGYYCPAGSTNATAALCPDGYVCTAGVVTLCTPGHYSGPQRTSCRSCAGGYYGNVSGLSSQYCSGPCPAGYACPAGSATPTACVPGQFSQALSAACMACPPGQYGSSTGLATSNCSGPCAGGYFGSSGGQTSEQCGGSCFAGYACPAGSTSATEHQCPAGQYSLAGAAACSPCSLGTYGASVGMSTSGCSALCPAGRYGDVMGLTTANCSGLCPAGYKCPQGATNATALPCPPGQYSTAGSDACSDCAQGYYGAGFASTNASCDGPCAPGYYGFSVKQVTSQCSGPCLAGYACGPGSTSATSYACPVGTFSTAGSAACTPCPAGRYGDAAHLSACTACPAGTFGSDVGLNASTCSGVCRWVALLGCVHSDGRWRRWCCMGVVVTGSESRIFSSLSRPLIQSMCRS